LRAAIPLHETDTPFNRSNLRIAVLRYRTEYQCAQRKPTRIDRCESRWPSPCGSGHSLRHAHAKTGGCHTRSHPDTHAYASSNSHADSRTDATDRSDDRDHGHHASLDAKTRSRSCRNRAYRTESVKSEKRVFPRLDIVAISLFLTQLPIH